MSTWHLSRGTTPPIGMRRWVRRVLGGVLMSAAALCCILLAAGALTGGWSVLTVPTGSMEPTIPVGAAVVVRPVPTDRVEVGDVIVFHAPGTGMLTVHRVVERSERNGHRVVRDPR